jgi:hypothetical protein
VFSLVSCQKYKYKEKDVYGVWNIGKYYVDGYDSTIYFDQFKRAEILFEENTDLMYINCDGLDTNQAFYIALSADWRFLDKNEKMNIDFKNSAVNPDYWLQSGPLSLGSNHNWDIVNLDENEFILQTDYNNKEYKLILK